MNFSLQTPPPSAPAPPEADNLPPLDRPSVRRRKSGGKLGMILAGVLVVAGVVVAGMFPGVQKVFAGFFKTSTSQVVKYKVTRGRLPVTVVERGNLESSNNDDVINEVEGQTTIIYIKPEGSQVKKGEMVCELDSATLRDSLINQEITTKQAFANLENAEKTLQVAMIAVNEYVEGTFPQERQQIESEIKLAMSELERASERLKWSEAMKIKNYVSDSSVISDKLSKQKSEISLANSQKKLYVLENFTKLKNTTEFEATVKKAESDKLAKEATYNLEKTKEEKLRKQIVKCKLYAPNDGLLVYASDQNQMRGGGQGILIAEGETVRERQKIFSLPDLTKIRVNTKVHESMIDRVEKGLPAKIKVDALPALPLAGKVESVQPLPDQSSFFSSDVKMYTTHVSVEGYNSALRPGMTAEVTILIAQLEDVLSVPVQAVVQAQGKDYVFVIGPDGPVRKEVTLGVTNQKVIEVKEGLKEGDEVAMNWNTLLTDEEKNKLFNTNTKTVTKDKDWANAPPTDPSKLPSGLTPKKAEPGKDDTAKAKGKGAAGRRGGMPGMDPAIMAKFQNIPQEDMMKMRSASPEERIEIMKAAGFTDAEITKMDEARKAMSGGGGPGGGGPGGPGGGAPGGGGGFGGGRPGGGGGVQ